MQLIALAILQEPYRLEGEELRFLRKHVDLTQEEFAKLLHVEKTTLSKWENNMPLRCRYLPKPGNNS